MNPLSWLREGNRLIYGIALLCLIVLAVFVLGRCTRGDEVREANAGRTQTEGRTVSAVEAINTINDLGERSNATDAEVESATNAIRQADPADRDRVFRYRACLLQHRPDCDGLL